MAEKQSVFLAAFKEAFEQRFAASGPWDGGQRLANTARMDASHQASRRAVGLRDGERFELGDARMSHRGRTIIVEFESGALELRNLLKYWPYIRGEMSSGPVEPIILCHFCDWWSYAAWRDLWEWTLSRMQSDPDRLVDIRGRQFDHWGREVLRTGDTTPRVQCISSALDWIATVYDENCGLSDQHS